MLEETSVVPQDKTSTAEEVETAFDDVGEAPGSLNKSEQITEQLGQRNTQ